MNSLILLHMCLVRRYSSRQHAVSIIVIPLSEVPQSKQLTDLCPMSVAPLLSRIAEKLIVKHWLRPAIPSETFCDQFASKPTGSTTCDITLRVFSTLTIIFVAYSLIFLKPLTLSVMIDCIV